MGRRKEKDREDPHLGKDSKRRSLDFVFTMEIEFDFKEEQSRLFGPVLRPVARIILINNEIEVPENVYVDSGADISLIPKSV